MKTRLYSNFSTGLLVILTFLCLFSCSTKKKAYVLMPCETPDTAEEFSAVGTATGDIRKKGIVQFHALFDANKNLSIQIRQSYKDFIKLNKDSTWTTLPASLERRLNILADSIIESKVEMAYQDCMRYGIAKNNEQIAAYTSIKISKTYIASVIATGYDNELSAEEKKIIQFEKNDYEHRLNVFLKSYVAFRR